MKVFTPQEAKDTKEKAIPNFVLEAFNQLLSEKYDDYAITITQDEAITRILALSCNENLTRQEIFDRKWLDIEDIYRANGWSVEYDKPGYNESYTAFFKFKPKKA